MQELSVPYVISSKNNLYLTCFLRPMSLLTPLIIQGLREGVSGGSVGAQIGLELSNGAAVRV